MSYIDISLDETKEMTMWDLEENLYWEIKYSHDPNNKYRDISEDSVVLLVNELYIRYQIKE